MPQTNLHQKPFDFSKWQRWLEEKANELRTDGFDVRYEVGNDLRKPKLNLQAQGESAGGYFTNWITGETDFEVMQIETGERILETMGLIVDDSTFEVVFEKFRNALFGTTSV